jgi:hypothetical protein
MSFGALIAELGLNTAPFRRGLDASKVYANKFASDAGSSLKSKFAGAFAGAFTGGAVVSGIQNAIQGIIGKAVEVKQLSREFSVTTDEIQMMQRAARKGGSDFSVFGAAIEKINSTRKDAAEGNKDLRETYSALGVSLNDLQDPLLRDYDIFLKVAEAVKNNATPAFRAFFKELAGKRAAEIIPVLGKLNDEFHGINKDTINSIIDAKKALSDLEMQATRMAAGPASSLAGVLNDERPLWARYLQGLAASQGGAGFTISRAIGAYFENQGKPGPLPGDENFIGPMPDPGKLYKDQIAAQQKIDLLKAQVDLKEAIRKIDFDSLSAQAKELALQERITDLKKEAHDLRENGGRERFALETEGGH